MVNVNQLITAVKKDFKKDPIRQKFTDILCHQMSDRTLLSLNKTELSDFISILYNFFIIDHHNESHIYFGKPQLESTALTNSLILKMSQPDASHLFITIEEIFRKHQLRSTRRLHPIIGIKRNKKVTSLIFFRPMKVLSAGL